MPTFSIRSLKINELVCSLCPYCERQARWTAAASTNAPFALAFSSDGFVAVSHWDGSVFRFKADGFAGATANCAVNGTSAATSIEQISASPGTNTGAGIAFDPVNSDRLIVVVPQHPTAAARVRAVERNATGAWIATNLADTLPSLASSRLTPTVATEALAGFTNVFYVGTQRGAWQGAVDTGGVTTWRQSLDSPDTWIADIQRADTTLRLASYGRGIWERRHFPRPCDSGACAQRPTATAHCLACWREAGSGASSASSTAAVEVDLSEKSTLLKSAIIVVVPMSGERPILSAAARVVSRNIDEKTLRVELALVGADAPLGVRVTALRLQTDINGAVVETVPVDIVLRRPEARVVTLRSILSQTSQVALASTMQVLRTSRAAEPLGDGQIAVLVGCVITVGALPETQRGERLSQIVVTMDARPAAVETGNSATITVRSDAQVTAFYH